MCLTCPFCLTWWGQDSPSPKPLSSQLENLTRLTPTTAATLCLRELGGFLCPGRQASSCELQAGFQVLRWGCFITFPFWNMSLKTDRAPTYNSSGGSVVEAELGSGGFYKVSHRRPRVGAATDPSKSRLRSPPLLFLSPKNTACCSAALFLSLIFHSCFRIRQIVLKESFVRNKWNPGWVGDSQVAAGVARPDQFGPRPARASSSPATSCWEGEADLKRGEGIGKGD